MKHTQEGAVRLPTEVRKGHSGQIVLTTVGFHVSHFLLCPTVCDTLLHPPKEHKRVLAIFSDE